MKTKSFFLAIAFFLIASLVCKAQTNDELINRFQKSFNNVLIKDNKSVFTVVRIKIDKQGRVGGITLSKSADSTFIKFFNVSKSALDIEALSTFVMRAKIRQKYLLMPLYVTHSDDKLIDATRLEHFMEFDNQDFEGPSIILKALRLSTEVIYN